MDPGPLLRPKDQRCWQPQCSWSHSSDVILLSQDANTRVVFFFSDSVITGQRVCLWGVPAASHGRINFSLFSPLSNHSPFNSLLVFLEQIIYSWGSNFERNKCLPPTFFSQPPSSLPGRMDSVDISKHICFPWFLYRWLCAINTIWYLDFLT